MKKTKTPEADGVRPKARFNRPPHLWQIIVLGALCALVTNSASYPRGRFLALFPGELSAWTFILSFFWPAALALLTGDFIIRVAVCVWRHSFRPRAWQWYTVPLLIAVTVAAWRTDRLVHWRFAANRAALESLATAMLDAASSDANREEFPLEWPWGAFHDVVERAGDYDIIGTAVFPEDRVVFLITGGFFRSGWGLLYDPASRVPDIMDVQPLGDGWSIFSFAKE